MTDDELIKAELNARIKAQARVKDVTPPERSRLSCNRGNEWLRLRSLLKSKGLKPIPLEGKPND